MDYFSLAAGNASPHKLADSLTQQKKSRIPQQFNKRNQNN